MSEKTLFDRNGDGGEYDNPALNENYLKTSVIYVRSKEIENAESPPDSYEIIEQLTRPKKSRDVINESDKESSSGSIEVLNLEEVTTSSKRQHHDVQNDFENNYCEAPTKDKKKKFKDKSEISLKKSVTVFEEQYSFGDLIESPSSEISISDPRTNLMKFLFTPPPKHVVVKCQLNKTNKNDKTMLFTKFIFSLQIPDKNENQKMNLFTLMAARSRKKSKTLNYVISTDASELKSDSSGLIGKMKGNFMGTKFIMYNKVRPNSCNTTNGETCGHSDSDSEEGDSSSHTPSNIFKIMGIIFYKNMSFIAKKPRDLSVAIPHWDALEEIYGLNLRLPNDKSELADFPEMCVLDNVEPTFNKSMKCFTLDFGGRAEKVSVKNFALNLTIDGEQKRVYQFGKCKDHYIIDYTYPLCAFQAFVIGLSSCHRKFATD